MRNLTALAIGVDVGGTKVAAGLVDDQGQVIARERRTMGDHRPEAVAKAVAEIVQVLRTAAGDAPVSGVGLGVPGYVSADRSTAVLVPNLGWRDIPFQSMVHELVGMPVLLDNDANVAAWAEYRFGAGRGAHSMVLITVGTGVGGGIVMDDRLIRGGGGMAAEVGHLNLVPGGRRCGCGKLGCWEQYASGSALVRYAREFAGDNRDGARQMLGLGDGTPEGITGAHVTAAAHDGDPVALQAFRETAAHLGEGLADLVALLDPEVIVVGGGVSEAGALLLDPLVDSYKRHVVVPAQRDGIDIRLATLRNDAGLIGAADITRFI